MIYKIPPKGILFHAWHNNFSVHVNAIHPLLAKNALGYIKMLNDMDL